jgi:hypothetical protein
LALASNPLNPNAPPISAYVKYAPTVKIAPCAKLIMPRMEKISVYPKAKMAYTLPIDKPLRNCCKNRVESTVFNIFNF